MWMEDGWCTPESCNASMFPKLSGPKPTRAEALHLEEKRRAGGCSHEQGAFVALMHAQLYIQVRSPNVCTLYACKFFPVPADPRTSIGAILMDRTVMSMRPHTWQELCPGGSFSDCLHRWWSRGERMHVKIFMVPKLLAVSLLLLPDTHGSHFRWRQTHS